MKNLLQHYLNPLHICCRIRDCFLFFGMKRNMREILNWRIMRSYDNLFRQIVY